MTIHKQQLIKMHKFLTSQPIRLRAISKILRAELCILKDLYTSKPNGKLSIVATPIGNLADLTPNILKCLFKADLIACEDRRVAGQLYTLIRNRNILGRVQQKFGTIGISNLVLRDQDQEDDDEDQNEGEDIQKKHQFYEYSNMGDKQRRKFLSKLSLEEEKKFKIDYLKYRAKKIINKDEQFLYNTKKDKFDQLYGIEVSDYRHIEAQILYTRSKKGRGLLIPMNTYSETKMFDMVKNMLESKNIAIVSDAGMPCISDPGWKMVRMVREHLPTVPIEVIGGPSAIDIMLTLAKVSSSSRTMSGRFQGFASPQVSGMTQESISLNKELQQAKQKDFSIHFINSKKMIKHSYILQRIYGQNQKIILANELTKKFEKKFNGTLKGLSQNISKDEKNFEGIGEMSYLLYNNKNLQVKEIQQVQMQKKDKKSESQNSEQSQSLVQSININKFAKALNCTGLKSLERAELIATVFNVKKNQAKSIVYEIKRKQQQSKRPIIQKPLNSHKSQHRIRGLK